MNRTISLQKMLIFLVLSVGIDGKGYIRMNSGILTTENFDDLPDSLARKYQEKMN